MRLLNTCLSLGVASVACGILAAECVALAFLGPAKAGALMSSPPLLALSGLLACGLAATGARAVFRRRPDSALLHLGCACVMAGWLAGRLAVRCASFERPATGYMALVDGYVSSELSDERQVVGRLPFSVRLMRFAIDRYEPSPSDRDEGRMPPVKEYSSLVLISEPGKKPYARKIRVNHPAYVCGYHIYQNSYREAVEDNQPVRVTILQFIRDPGLPVVYAGFLALFAGVLLFAGRVMWRAAGTAAGGEVSP